MADILPYRDLFVSEAHEHLQLMNEAILALERARAAGVEPPRDDPALDQLFRSAHTLKSMAGAMGYGDMARLAHALEDLLDAVRAGQIALAPERIDLCFAATDMLTAALAAVVADAPPPAGLQPLLHALASGPAAPEPAGTGAARAAGGGLPAAGYDWALEVTLADDCRLCGLRARMVLERLGQHGRIVATDPPAEELAAERFGRAFRVALATAAAPEELVRAALSVAEVAAATPRAPGAAPLAVQPDAAAEREAAESAATQPPAPSALDLSRSVRVQVRQLDRLLNLVGELVIVRGELERLGAELDNPRLAGALEAHARILAELQGAVFTARLVTIAQIFDRFPRMVRDLLVAERKEADLVVEGRELEVDRALLQPLAEILVHLLRNAVDHGIESPAERARAGKPPRGTIRLAARRERELLVVAVDDDGRGIDRERIAAFALERGLLTAEALAALSDEELLLLICTPSFSTAGEVTTLSGRGVGLAAVRRQVEALRGTLAIQGERGVGTRFQLHLPFSLAIIPALLVTAAGETFAVPFDAVAAVREVVPGAATLVAPDTLELPDGARLPAVALEQLLDLAPAPAARADNGARAPRLALITAHGRQPAAVIVDGVAGKEEIVVKTLPPALQAIPGLAGATIVGAGQVVLILDLPQLVGRLV